MTRLKKASSINIKLVTKVTLLLLLGSICISFISILYIEVNNSTFKLNRTHAITRHRLFATAGRVKSPETAARDLPIKVNVVFTAFSPVRFPNIAQSIQQLQDCTSSIVGTTVEQIILVWNSPLPLPTAADKVSPFWPFLSNEITIPIHAVIQDSDSPLNKFHTAATRSLQVQSNIFVDDAISVSCQGWTDLLIAASSSPSLIRSHATVYSPSMQSNKLLPEISIGPHTCYRLATQESKLTKNEYATLPSPPPLPKIMVVPVETLNFFLKMLDNPTELHDISPYCESDILLEYAHSMCNGHHSRVVIDLNLGPSVSTCNLEEDFPLGKRLHLKNVPSFATGYSKFAKLQWMHKRAECQRSAKNAASFDVEPLMCSPRQNSPSLTAQCPPSLIKKTCRSEPDSILDVPGDLLVSSRSIVQVDAPFTRNSVIPWTYNRSDDFFERGVAGPFPVLNWSTEELNNVFEAMKLHRRRIQQKKHADEAKFNSSRPYEAQNHYDKYGDTDFRIERCYAFDERCRRLAEDPAILEQVKKIIKTDDVIVWSMTDFSKGNSTIQPWHTDNEPYDRCYNSNVQIWLAVDGVSPSSTLQVLTHSHRFPSATWMYPSHIGKAKRVDEKLNFEQDTILPCAKAIHQKAEIVAPVIRNGEYFIFHSNMWHAAHDLIPPHLVGKDSRRKAIRITYSHPNCQIGGIYKFQRPDLPPLMPIATLPPVLLVSGKVSNSLDMHEGLQLTNAFMHHAQVPVQVLPQLGQSTSSESSLLSAALLWKDFNKLTPLWMEETNNVFPVLKRSSTKLLQSLELSLLRLKPHTIDHEPESSKEAIIYIVIEGQVGIFTIANENAHNGTAISIPQITLLPKGSLNFVDAETIQSAVSGSQGAWSLQIKYQFHPEINIAKNIPSFHSFVTPPKMSTFFKDYAKHLSSATTSCIHALQRNSNRETIILIETIPQGVTLSLLPDHTPMQEKTILFFPVDTTYGIEARNMKNDQIMTLEQISFDAAPNCIRIDFWD